jgi:hypothetical protein
MKEVNATAIPRGHGAIHIPRSQDLEKTGDTSPAAQASDDNRGPKGHGAIHTVQPSKTSCFQDSFSALTGPTLDSIAVIEKRSPPQEITTSKGRGGGMVAWPQGDLSNDILTIQDKQGDRSWYDY